jgi:hypothetical protein
MKRFFKGLLAAAAGGAVSVLNDPHSLATNPKAAGKVALGGAAIAVIAYLAKSPLAEDPKAEPIAPAASNEQHGAS